MSLTSVLHSFEAVGSAFFALARLIPAERQLAVRRLHAYHIRLTLSKPQNPKPVKKSKNQI